MSDSEANKFVRKKLTPFLAHEMIYDYATGQLDTERRAALEEFLATDTESQVLLKNIERAQGYCEKLKKVSVDAETLLQLQEAESAVSLGKRYSSWKEWPETLRWSITAIALSAVVAGSVALVPWSKLSPSKKSGAGPETVEVAQIPQPKSEDTTEVAANEDNGSGDEAPEDMNDEGSGDDVADSGDDESGAPSKEALAAIAAAQKQKATPTPTATPVAVAANKVGGLTPPASIGRSTPAPFVSVNLPTAPAQKPAAPAPTPAPASNASTKLTMSVTADSHAAGDAKARGFVYRAFMTLDNLEEIGPKITSDIVALGGEKAGEVELGWRRGSGRYYHFALPEDNEKKILERLQVYGPVRISKDPHPRIMPPGKVRFILWIDSASDPSPSP